MFTKHKLISIIAVTRAIFPTRYPNIPLGDALARNRVPSSRSTRRW